MLRRIFLAAAAAGLMLATPVAGQMFTPHEPLNPAKAQSLDLVPLVIESGGSQHKFMVEVADTDQKRMTGLMHRNQLAADHGMLFDFQRTREVKIWMRNTFIPLDLLFMQKDGTVAYTVEHMIPHNEQSVGPSRPMYAVLEIPDGTVAKLGLKVGDIVHHEIFGNAVTKAK